MLQPTQVLTVSQLNTYVKYLLEETPALQELMIAGEVSNFKNYPGSGHWYFTLKDANASIPAVMFKTANLRLRFEPHNGMHVLIRGRVSIYERDGKYQLYADDMQPDGLGALYLAYEQLKERLEKEGLFEAARKQPIPQCPARVGVITSGTGAAVRDILQILARRFPAAEVILCPVQVQGVGASAQIAAAIAMMNRKQAADALIVGRGGGSLEDLWAFNEEGTVRAVAASKIPIISAVGHETDVTICDFAADLRAATPSEAAELAVPDQREVQLSIKALQSACARSLQRIIDDHRRSLYQVMQKRVLQSPEALVNAAHQRLDFVTQRLQTSVQQQLFSGRAKLEKLCGQLNALSPLAVLSRGYAIAKKDGKLVTRIEELAPFDRLQ